MGSSNQLPMPFISFPLTNAFRGMRRREFLRKHHGGIYTGLLLSGKLNAHLEEIDRSANEMLNLLITQYAERERITEELKAQDQMEWIRRMGSIRERAEETVFSELIYL